MPRRPRKPEPLRHAGHTIDYEVVRRPRVRRRIHLELSEAGGLRVVAPRWMSRGDIHRTLQDNAAWAARFLERARARQAELPRLRYVDGEHHLLLGQRYPIDIRTHTGRRRRVEWVDGSIRMLVPAPGEPDRIRDQLLGWYRERAAAEFGRRLETIWAAAEWTGGQPPPLRLRRMTASWGTCSAEGVITLNPLLLRAPPGCIDYVIAHEVCHLREHNHGPRFYALQRQLYPGWREARRHLQERGHVYLHL
jgi:predicted metal-dependent hydrolase